MEFITALQEQLVGMAQAAVSGFEGKVEAISLSAMEQAVQGVLQAVGQTVLSSWLERQEARYPPDTVACDCGQAARYERRRQAVTLTLQGRVTYRRAYYRCRCGCGRCPLDDRLGIRPGHMSEQVVKVATVFGVTDAFASGAELLATVTGLDLSPNSLRAACQEVGQQVLAHEAALAARSQDLAAQRVQRRTGPRPKRLYGSLDGFQGPFTDGWHEVKMGTWWTVDERQHVAWVRYYADTCPAETLADLVWARGFEVGAHQAEELVFIADGAVWIWNIVQRHFPNAVQIVDFYHASGYLAQVARAAFGDGTPEARQWLQIYSHLLHEGRLSAVVQACKRLADRAPQAVAALRHYFAVNRTRLRYGKFRALGFQIGSGIMESGCKQLGTERLKIAGARWSREGGRLLAKARAAVLSRELNLLPARLPQVA